MAGKTKALAADAERKLEAYKKALAAEQKKDGEALDKVCEKIKTPASLSEVKESNLFEEFGAFDAVLDKSEAARRDFIVAKNKLLDHLDERLKKRTAEGDDRKVEKIKAAIYIMSRLEGFTRV